MEQEFVSALKRFQNMLSFKKKTVFVSTITSLQDWPVNSNLDLALEVLQPIKVFFSFADQDNQDGVKSSKSKSIFVPKAKFV